MSLYSVILEYVWQSPKDKAPRTRVKRVEVFATDGVDAMERAEKLERQAGHSATPLDFYSVA